MQRIAATVAARGGALIVDEIYLGLRTRGRPQTALALTDDIFVISSFSKYFNMTGWRLGWLVAPERHVRDLEKLAQNLYISPPTLSQRAALACFEPATLAILETRRRANSRRGATSWCRPCASWASAIPVMPTGGFFVYADCSPFGLDSERSAARRSRPRASRSRPASISARIAPATTCASPIRSRSTRLREGVRRLAGVAAGTCAADDAFARSCWRSLAQLAGCTTAEYYWQGIRGQFDLLGRAQPIASVVDETGDPALKRKLERVVAIRNYASRELGAAGQPELPPLHRARSPFRAVERLRGARASLKPRQWCFPIAGCVNYRGYFNEAAARAEAAELAAAGDDVHIGGVPAYSTLGYFADPMLSTFIRYPDIEIARLIFHELAHQVAYAKDDTVFNESFAVAVEQEGLKRWLAAQNDPALTAQFASTQRYARGIPRRSIDRTQHSLEALYASDASVVDKRAGKAAAFAQMRADYDALKREWGGYAAYDNWFAQGPNNASLAAVGLYTRKVPEFAALLASEDGDLPRFYARVQDAGADAEGRARCGAGGVRSGRRWANAGGARGGGRKIADIFCRGRSSSTRWPRDSRQCGCPASIAG